MSGFRPSANVTEHIVAMYTIADYNCDYIYCSIEVRYVAFSGLSAGETFHDCTVCLVLSYYRDLNAKFISCFVRKLQSGVVVYSKYLNDWMRFTAIKNRRILMLLGKFNICVSCVTCWLVTVACCWHIVTHMNIGHPLSFNLKRNKRYNKFQHNMLEKSRQYQAPIHIKVMYTNFFYKNYSPFFGLVWSIP